MSSLPIVRLLSRIFLAVLLLATVSSAFAQKKNLFDDRHFDSSVHYKILADGNGASSDTVRIQIWRPVDWLTLRPAKGVRTIDMQAYLSVPGAIDLQVYLDAKIEKEAITFLVNGEDLHLREQFCFFNRHLSCFTVCLPFIEYEKVAQARTISIIVGKERFSFTPDQIVALKKFAQAITWK